MLLSFHWAETRCRRIKNPTEYVSLEESLDLPNIEEVDVLPTFTAAEHEECIKLEEIGAEILNKIYAADTSLKVSIKCKGIAREEYRF
ncbi:hypothetical protein NEAUS03_2232 [Nematocida ausubeli]|nr:hypothetical protein NEAUS03_2232 [Nematocida ausubeli]